jgi:hypothetical protein
MIEDPVTEMDDRLELSGAGMKRCSNFTNWERVLQRPMNPKLDLGDGKGSVCGV